ncbi:MAG: hypothetical protein CND83_01590 [Rhodothermaeota bacterium MED-G19]|nr:MAG: hypothetical protein CND83_01590 [Rhodothermaeota bacterium MED-G19]
MLRSNWFKKYLLPGFIFQSFVIGGGYGTGREIVEFFLLMGPRNGIYGMLVSMVIWCIVLACTFELSRQFKSYDYRSFLINILGRGWILYEFTYLIGLILVISVLGSAAGNLTMEVLGIPTILGTVVMIFMVGILAFFGSRIIEAFLSYWSIFLYIVFLVLIIWINSIYGHQITNNFSLPEETGSWFKNGIMYAAYNVGPVAAILFCLTNIETRREAITSGILAGIIAIIPGFMIYYSLVSFYPAINEETIPTNFILDKIGSTPFKLSFQLILFGTFIETGVGLIHGFNERVSNWLKTEKNMDLSRSNRFIISTVLLVISIFIAEKFGLVNLIANGYGTLTWAYWLVFVIPVLFVAIKKNYI